MESDNEGGTVAKADEGGIAALGFGAELTPSVVIHVVAFDFVTVSHAPAAFFILDNVWEGDVPAGIVGDEIGDLTAGSSGGGCGGLEDEEAIVRIETDAEGKEGDADRSGFGGTTKGFYDKSLTGGASRV
jgi:hypothetical protein